MSVETGFDRFLLFHPQRDLTYIRKLTMSYGYYTALAVVNGNDRVTHVGVGNSFQIVSFNELEDNDRSILGVERCNQLEDDDLLSVYRITRALKLKDSYKLWRPCRNMRYTAPIETSELKKLMQDTLNNPSLEFHDEKGYDYNTAYSDYVELDLENIDLTSDVQELELPSFDSMGAEGQTRLL